MTGQILPYGKRGYAKRGMKYLSGWNRSIYYLKSNSEWHTRSEYGSKTWHVWGPNFVHYGPFRSLTAAMDIIDMESTHTSSTTTHTSLRSAQPQSHHYPSAKKSPSASTHAPQPHK